MMKIRKMNEKKATLDKTKTCNIPEVKAYGHIILVDSLQISTYQGQVELSEDNS